MAKRYVQGYQYAVAWVAGNDEPGQLVAEDIRGQVTVMLLADIYGRDPIEVARAVVAYRRKQLEAKEAARA